MNAESRWMPDDLGELTMVQLRCLESAEAPGDPAVLESASDLTAALAAIDAEEAAWHA